MNPIYSQLARQQRTLRESTAASKATTGAGRQAASAADWQLFFEREAEVGELYRVLNHRKGGRSPVVIVHGDGSCGKTTLVRRGLIPKFEREFSGVFEPLIWTTKNGSDHRDVVTALAGQVLSQLPARTHDELSGQEIQQRIRHFALLFAGESGEAAEYLAALFREAHIDRGPTDAARCLIFIDQFDRFFPNGLVADATPEWVDAELIPLMTFLYDLALTNAFPLVIALRSFNVDGLKQALARCPRRMTLDWKPLDPLPPDTLTELVDRDLSLPAVEPALVARCEELLAKHPGALAFLEATWRAQGTLQRPPLQLKFFEGEHPLEKIIAGAAEAAIEPFCSGPEPQRVLHQLLDLFFPVPEDGGQLKPMRLPFARLAERPEVVPLAEALIDARVLHPGGNRHGNASIAWSVPRFFRNWERGFNWLQRDRELRESAQKLESNVSAWQAAEQTPVLLLHGTASVEMARELVSYDSDRPFLSAPMREYLKESVETEARLHKGSRPIDESNDSADGEASGQSDSGGDADGTAPLSGRDWLGMVRGLVRGRPASSPDRGLDS